MSDPDRPDKEQDLASMAAVQGATAGATGAYTLDDAGSPGPSDEVRAARTEELMDCYHPAVYRYAFWMTGCQSSAEDITQEVFLRAFRGLHHLRDPRAAKSWLMTITRNEFARWCKKRPPKPLADLEDCQQATSTKELETENFEWVRQGISELPSEFRLVVLMYYYEQLSYAEIAEQLAIPIGTVMSRLSRGRSHLKQALNRLAEPNT